MLASVPKPVFARTPVPAALATGSTGRGQAQWRLEGPLADRRPGEPARDRARPEIVQRDCALRR